MLGKLGFGLFGSGGCGSNAFFKGQFGVDLGEFQELKVGAAFSLVCEEFVLHELLP